MSKYESPFDEWEGSVEIVDYISPAAFNEWWAFVNSDEYENDTRHPLLKILPSRSKLIKSLTLNGFEFDGTAESIPDMRVLAWLNNITTPILTEATSFLALPDKPTDT